MILHLSWGPSRQCTMEALEKVRRQVMAEGLEVRGIEVTDDERVQMLERCSRYQLGYETAIPSVRDLRYYGSPVIIAS